MTGGELETKIRGASGVLELETRQDAIPFKKPRSCPDCAQVMAPMRIGRLEAWVERCPTCEGLWVEASDLSSIELVTRSIGRQEAWQSLDDGTRKEIARDLAEHEAPKDEGALVQELSAGEVAQLVVGVPVLQSLEGAQRPIGTLLSLFVIALIFVGGLTAPELLGFDALGYQPGDDGLWKAFVAVFAHDGWIHALGNLAFGLVFGDAVERKSQRWVVPTALFGIGGLSLLIDGATSHPEAIIGGASGGVFALMGLATVLQRRARWIVPLLHFAALRLPLPFVMIVYALIDGWIGSQTSSGIAWLAHASGLVAGIGLGVVLNRAQDAAEPSRGS